MKLSSVRQNAVWTSTVQSGPDFYYFFTSFVEIMPDKAILDHKKS